VSHPSLGLPPDDPFADASVAARRVHDRTSDLAARALAVAIDRDPTSRERYDEVGLRARLHDAEMFVDRLAIALATERLELVAQYADWTVPMYRRKRVPLDDMIALCEGLKAALPGVLSETELPPAYGALDEAIAVYRNQRRLAGDARKRNRFIQFIYKGA
jgi:hypothetical protein